MNVEVEDDGSFCNATELGRNARVAFEQSAESLFTSNVAQADRIDIKFGLLPFLSWRFLNQFVFQALMRSFKMIMILEFLAKDIHVLVPENYKMVQTFLLNTLYETLDEGNRIR